MSYPWSNSIFTCCASRDCASEAKFGNRHRQGLHQLPITTKPQRCVLCLLSYVTHACSWNEFQGDFALQDNPLGCHQGVSRLQDLNRVTYAGQRLDGPQGWGLSSAFEKSKTTVGVSISSLNNADTPGGITVHINPYRQSGSQMAPTWEPPR
jgi:hypothetical protein